MQSIERYGVIALLFLVVTVVAVLMWDTGEAPPSAERPGPAVAIRPLPATTAPAPAPATRESVASRAPAGPAARTSWREEPLAAARPALSEDQSVLDAPLAAPRTLEARRPAPGEERPLERRAEPERAGTARLAAAPAATPPASDRLYLVRPGDTLGEIAQRTLGTSRRWQELVALNPGLDPERMQVGARLVLPPDAAGSAGATPAAGAPRGSAAASAPSPTRAPADGRTYRVQAGDSLWRIAARELGDGERWRDILALNPGLDAERITVGLRLALPAGKPLPKEAAPSPRVAKAGPSETSETSEPGARQRRVR